MRIHRIYAIVLRYMYYMIHSIDRMSDMFYWPTVDLLLWGITSLYIKNNTQNVPNIVLMIVSGILLWIIIWRGQYEITVNFLEELWNKNLVNLFVSPLKLSEWIIAVGIIGILKMTLSLTFASLMAFFLYKANILYYGWYLIPFGASLILTGWAVGFFITGIILRYGTKVQTLAWTAIMLISPFSAVYYPLSVLPLWAQKVAKFIPTSYVFENSRLFLFKGYVNWTDLWISYGLNILYLFLAIVFFYKSFTKAKERGLIGLF